MKTNNNMELWTLRIDMYKDWATENGACELIGIFDKKYKAIRELEKNLKMEKEQGYILNNDEKINDIINYIKEYEKNTVSYVDIYCSKYGYDYGNSCATYVLEKKILNLSKY